MQQPWGGKPRALLPNASWFLFPFHFQLCFFNLGDVTALVDQAFRQLVLVCACLAGEALCCASLLLITPEGGCCCCSGARCPPQVWSARHSSLTQASPSPSTAWSAFPSLLLCSSVDPGLADAFDSAFCFTLYFLCTLSAEPLERLYGGSCSLLGHQFAEISWSSASITRESLGTGCSCWARNGREWRWQPAGEQGSACPPRGIGEMGSSCTFIAFHLSLLCGLVI